MLGLGGSTSTSSGAPHLVNDTRSCTRKSLRNIQITTGTSCATRFFTAPRLSAPFSLFHSWTRRKAGFVLSVSKSLSQFLRHLRYIFVSSRFGLEHLAFAQIVSPLFEAVDNMRRIPRFTLVIVNRGRCKHFLFVSALIVVFSSALVLVLFLC